VCVLLDSGLGSVVLDLSRPLTILLADDNAPMRRTIATILADLLPAFYECSDGDEAVRAYARCRPDWVVMDIRMPLVDGLTACRRIKAADPAANIVVLTQYADEDMRSAALAAGAVAFFRKEDILALRHFLTRPRIGFNG
jgi:CheY-like chemotaxis protein